MMLPTKNVFSGRPSNNPPENIPQALTLKSRRNLPRWTTHKTALEALWNFLVSLSRACVASSYSLLSIIIITSGPLQVTSHTGCCDVLVPWIMGSPRCVSSVHESNPKEFPMGSREAQGIPPGIVGRPGDLTCGSKGARMPPGVGGLEHISWDRGKAEALLLRAKAIGRF